MHESLPLRHAGALLHINSLPSAKLDDDALRWLDFVAAAGISVWQLLPLVIPDSYGSPYQSRSAFAINPDLLGASGPVNQSEFEVFCGNQAHWLDDFALYEILKQQMAGQVWFDWPDRYRHRDPNALQILTETQGHAIMQIKEQQYLLDRAWHRIRQHATDLGVRLFGDIPIFIAHDSADTWSQPQQFLLDHEGRPTYVTGVPPDYFSETGQRWGNPHYRWDVMQDQGFDWWIDRMRRQFDFFDLVRIDHFRGLVGVWMIAADSPTAIDGHWEKTPGDALLETLQKRFDDLPIVAEDLGIITEEVRTLRRKYGLPGMSVLQFAFDHFEDNPHKPVNIGYDTVVYTGTHDNDTAVGWFEQLPPDARDFVFSMLGVEPTADIARLLIETAMNTAAMLAVAPLQDYLGLGSEARLNTPGTAGDNWHWQFSWDMLDQKVIDTTRAIIEQGDRYHAV